MKPLCCIPARRGSKRLALKNLLPLGGKPMLAWSIEAALASGVFDAVWVSTEDEEIGAAARSWGAVVHERPAELAGDLVSATDVCLDLYEARRAEGQEHHAIVCLQPSSPLRSAEDVVGAWETFEASGADFLVSATPIDPHYFHWALQERGEYWGMFFGDRFLIERPLLPPVLRPNGSIKIGRVGPLLDRRNFFGERLTIYETPEERSVHVATAYDFSLAQHLLAKPLEDACPDP